MDAVKKLRDRIYLMLGRAVLMAIDDSEGRQYAQLAVLRGELKDRVERVQNYGFTSVPLPGSQALILCLTGNRDHPLVVALDDPRYRKKGMKPGEVAIYTDEGDFIWLRRGRKIEIETQTLIVRADVKARFETPTLECTGEIIDRVDDNGRTMNNMREVYDTHVHPENDDAPGPTDAPTQKMGDGA